MGISRVIVWVRRVIDLLTMSPGPSKQDSTPFCALVYRECLFLCRTQSRKSSTDSCYFFRRLLREQHDESACQGIPRTRMPY